MKQLSAFFIRNHRAVQSTNLRLASLVAIVVVTASLVFSVTPFEMVYAAGPFNVNTTNDTHCSGFSSQGAPGCTAVTDSGGHISLRSALEEANTAGGTTTINLPAGTYNLSLGDLVAGTQANTTITIQGAGAATTIINQTTAGRMVIVQNYNVNSNVVLNLSNVTISGGSENENDPDGFGGNGGAILAGGSASATGVAVSITNSTFSGNFCSPVSNAGCTGGAISMTGGGSLTITGSTFSGNTASKNSGFGGGGAVYFDNGGNGGNVSITNSTFTNNTAQGNATTGGVGGAVFLAGGSGTTYTVTTNTFTGNAVKGTGGAHGGAIYKPSGTLNASFNYIVGNTSDGDASGLYVGNNAGSIGNATDNWWGCNGGPSTTGCDKAVLGTPNQGGSMTVSPWIVLTNTANPNPIQVNQTTTLTADFLHNSTGGSLTASQVSLLIGRTVTWGNAVRGALSNEVTTIQANGTATATFTASAAGAGSADAKVDNGTATGSVTINKADTTTTITSDTPDPTVTGQSYTVNFTMTSNTGSTPTAPTGSVTVSDGTDTCSGTIASGTCTITSTTAGAKTLTATYSGDSNFNVSTSAGVAHTVNKADTTTTITSETPNPSVVGQSVTFNYSVAVNSPGSGHPTGTVTVTDGGSNNCTGTVSVGGTGSCTIAFPAAGSFSLTATYAGDANYNASPASSTVSQTVNKADTTTTITSDTPDPSVVGQAVTVNYTVTVNSPGAGTPTGNVTVTDGVDSCTNPVASGSCNITLSTPGARTLTATYAGDSNFNGSTSAGEPHTVGQPPAITSANNTTFTVGTNGSFTVTATGFPAPTFSETGALPSGVTLSSAGVLSGTPAAGTGGVYAITITATNGLSPDATQSFTLTVNEAPSITSANNTTFTVGTAGSFTVTTHGYPAPTISESGTLPNGVNLTDNGDGTATLAGTPAAGTGGSYSLTLTAHNTSGADATQTFTLTVNQAPAITSANSVTFNEGQAGTFTVTTTGFPTPTLSETGTLPSGVTFTDNGDGTGALSGTPGAGTHGTYSIIITAHNSASPDANQTFTLTVNPPLNITSANHATFTAGTAGSFTVTTIGTPTPTLSESGALPNGVTFTDNGNGTATLAGTPATGTGGTYALTITAHNGVAPDATQSFTLTVNEAPTITSANNATFVVGSAGSFSVTTGHSYPTPSITESGALPSGVTFVDNHDGTATLSGTPAAGSGGIYSLTLTASNGIGSPATQSFTLTVNEAPNITSGNSTTFNVGTAGTFSVAATGFPLPSLSESGALPNGVTFVDNHNGTATLAGTPAAGTGGMYSLTITASNGVGSNATQNFTLTVNQAPKITSANNVTFTEGQAGTFTVTATGFPVPGLTESGALPSGVTFTDNGNGTGTLAGTPASGSHGTYNISFTAQNGVGSNAVQAFTLTVLGFPDLTITKSHIGNFAQGASGNYTITVSNAVGMPTSGTVRVVDNLPTGLTGIGLSGTGWTCNLGTMTCTRADALPAGNSYPAITLTVNVASTAPISLTNTATVSGGGEQNTANDTASDPTTIQQLTTLLYNGDQIVIIGNSFKPAALLSSSYAACVSSKTISFSLDRNPTTGTVGSYSLGTAITNSSGQATMTAVGTSGWQEGIYTLTSSFAGTSNCIASSYDATLTVGGPGDSANGGGWYTLSGSGRINFGFTISKTDNSCTVNCTYKGQLLLMNNSKWKLKGTLNSFVKTTTGTGAASGTGDLFWWNQSLNGGLGDWVLAQSGVSFTINFFDSGKTGKSSTDTFGINIQYTPVPPQPSTLPNSTPQLLKGGDIKVK